MTVAQQTRTWTYPRRMLEELLGLTLLVWGGFVVVIAGIIIGIDIFDTISGSVWEPATQVTRWFAMAIGVYVGHKLLPRYVTHGQTRRDFAIQAAIFIVVFAAALAVLIVAGYLLEMGLFEVAGWSQTISNDHLFTRAGQLPLIFAEYWLMFLVWTAVGALFGAGFYRSDEAGMLTIPLALIPLALADLAIGIDWGPVGFLVTRVFDPLDPPLAVSLVISLASAALAMAMTWPFVRDIPIRNTSS
jgi:hypothetical protein